MIRWITLYWLPVICFAAFDSFMAFVAFVLFGWWLVELVARFISDLLHSELRRIAGGIDDDRADRIVELESEAIVAAANAKLYNPDAVAQMQARAELNRAKSAAKIAQLQKELKNHGQTT